jgi:hypothetical protein
MESGVVIHEEEISLFFKDIKNVKFIVEEWVCKAGIKLCTKMEGKDITCKMKLSHLHIHLKTLYVSF